MYDELLEKEIIPGIEQESLEELSDAELLQVAEQLDEKKDAFTCPNGQKLPFRYVSNRKDSYGFTRTLKVYECVECLDCPLREQCTKVKEGNNRTIRYNEKWEQQKKIIKDLLSDEKTGAIYGKGRSM